MVHADLGALNEKDEAGKKPSCWFSNRTPSLALLGRAGFIVCIVMQMSLGKIMGAKAWRWEQGLADVGGASCASVGHKRGLGQGLHCCSLGRFSYSEHSISLWSLISLSVDPGSTHKISCLDWGFSTLTNTPESLTLTK